VSVGDLSSGKGHRDENFPVASILIAKRHRPAILAFYNFARAADDVADNPTAAPAQKLAVLEKLRTSLEGEEEYLRVGDDLRVALADRNLSFQHARDLLEAFRRDCVKPRTADWADLMDYCRYSAMPVGRFVLDVHGESRATWPANDALCAALQVINHLQDCAKDYRELGRVYIPQDMLEQAGLTVDVLTQPKSPPALRAVLTALARRTQGLLADAKPFAAQIKDGRGPHPPPPHPRPAQRTRPPPQKRDARPHFPQPGPFRGQPSSS
jgi:squalene synthase HpnC